MNFDFVHEADVEPIRQTALLGMQSLALIKYGEGDEEYHPPADVMVEDLERFLNAAREDLHSDLDDPILPVMMSKVLGFSLVWACGYRWAISPSGLAEAEDVIVSPDEHYYLDPLDLVLAYLEDGEPSLCEIFAEVLNDELPEGEYPMEIPLED